MEVRITETYDELSEAACELVLAQVKGKPDSVLALAAGSTPLLLYKKLVQAYQNGRVDFSRVKTFCLDEYIGLPLEHEQSYHTFMRKNLFDHCNFSSKNIYLPNGMADDIAAECARYSAAIESVGGIDVAILGIGANAHIGFNEPGEVFVPETHVVELTPTTREANARFFKSVDDMPTWAISMGIRDIMYSKDILLLASGAGKTEAVYQAVCGDISPEEPASILQLHRNVLILADKAAAARLPENYY